MRASFWEMGGRPATDEERGEKMVSVASSKEMRRGGGRTRVEGEQELTIQLFIVDETSCFVDHPKRVDDGAHVGDIFLRFPRWWFWEKRGRRRVWFEIKGGIDVASSPSLNHILLPSRLRGSTTPSSHSSSGPSSYLIYEPCSSALPSPPSSSFSRRLPPSPQPTSTFTPPLLEIVAIVPSP